MIIKEVNITINVSNMDKSIAFYKAIGFKEDIRWGNYYAKLSLNTAIIGLHPAWAESLVGNSGNISIGLYVQEINEAAELLKEATVNYQLREEEGGQFIHFNDPDGTALYFINPKY
jgi:catechol 2,3-dioxygenase-like lactoylglutathione lyase family enzyme